MTNNISFLLFLKKKIICLLVFFIILPIRSYAFNAPKETDYFASLRASEVNVRAGPGQNYPIKFTFKLRGLPIKVISEYDNWSEVRDYDGETGWINQSLLTKKRVLMVRTAKNFVNFYSKPAQNSRVLLKVENGVIGEFIKCNDKWCLSRIVNKAGWVKKEDLWGWS